MSGAQRFPGAGGNLPLRQPAHCSSIVFIDLFFSLHSPACQTILPGTLPWLRIRAMRARGDREGHFRLHVGVSVYG